MNSQKVLAYSTFQLQKIENMGHKILDRALSATPQNYFAGFLQSNNFMKREALAKVAHSVIPAKAGIQNSLNPAYGGTGFRVAPGLLRGCPE